MITNAMAAAIGGMTSQGTRFLHIGNNIANSSTTAFKTGDAIFAETLTYASGRTPSGHRTQPGGGVTILGTEYDFSDGQLLDDEDEFHLGIQGDGFFPVTLGGLDYVTRAGDFNLVPNPGTLPVAGGFVMMRANGSMLQGSATAGGPIIGGSLGIIHFDAAPTSVDIGSDGVMDVLPVTVGITNGNIGYKNYVNTDALIREDGQLFLESPLASPVDAVNLIVPGLGGTGFLRQKTLEQSNVDLTNEFTKMIVTQRNFQANAKTITTADEMLNVAINVKR